MDIAIRKGEYDSAKMFLDTYTGKANFDLIHFDDNGDTPSILAVRENEESLVRGLLNLGVDTEHRKNNGHTALLVAVEMEIR